MNQQIGYQGQVTTKPFFLDTNGSGSAGWEKDSAIFYVYAYNNAEPSTYKWISEYGTRSGVTISGSGSYTLHVFRIDVNKYDRFNFVRFNPNGANIPSWNREDSPKSLWDQTSAQTYSSSTNYYKVNSSTRIINGDGYGHDTASISTTSKVNESSGNLVWA